MSRRSRPEDVVVTAKVSAQAKGPKIRIGKYKKRTGYKRHTGFRAALTQIEIESIGGARKRAERSPKAARRRPNPGRPSRSGPAARGGSGGVRGDDSGGR